jgi:hypothetical protein
MTEHTCWDGLDVIFRKTVDSWTQIGVCLFFRENGVENSAAFSSIASTGCARPTNTHNGDDSVVVRICWLSSLYFFPESSATGFGH